MSLLYFIHDNVWLIFRQFSTISGHLPLHKDTGENLDYSLYFSRLSHAKSNFSTIACISRPSKTILDYRLQLSRLLYTFLTYCIQFSTTAYISRYTFVQFGLPYITTKFVYCKTRLGWTLQVQSSPRFTICRSKFAYTRTPLLVSSHSI